MTYRIRPSTPTDCEVLGRVHSAAWRETYHGILPDDVLATAGSVERRTAIRQEIFATTTPRHLHLLVENNAGNVVGCADCGPAREVTAYAEAEITTLYLLRHAQQQGLGRQLLHTMLQHLTKASFASVALKVLLHNQKSRLFYEKCGGQQVAESVDVMGGQGVPTVVYRWSGNALHC